MKTTIKFLLALMTFNLFLILPSEAQKRNTFRFNRTSPVVKLNNKITPWLSLHGLTSSKYQSNFTKYAQKGYRLTHISGYAEKNSARFAAIWEKKSGPAWKAHHNMTASQYQSKFTAYARQGYRLTLVDGYAVGNTDYYVAIWEKKSGPAWKAHHGMTAAQYQIKFTQYANQGFRLVMVSGYSKNGSARYAAIWEKKSGPAWKAHHGMTAAQYQSKFNAYNRQGFSLSQVSAYQVGSTDFYAAIWEKKSRTYNAKHGMTPLNYQREFENQYYQGFRLKLVEGYAANGKTRYAAIWESENQMKVTDISKLDNAIQNYMNQHSIPGLSVAITKDERLVFAKGYGFANKATQEKVSPANLFRIASVSKPVTSAAIMKLIEMYPAKVQINSKVFGPGAVLGTRYGTKSYSTYLKQITVQHLLEHTAGFSNAGGDVMFKNFTNHADLINWTLDNRSLASKPGTKNDYSNFGYCILGRIIEQVSGLSYEAFVKKHVLGKCGIQNMRIGGQSIGSKKKNEVVYYSGNGPYSLSPSRMDANGGWIASPIDLTRFMASVDKQSGKKDILTVNSLNTMFKKSTIDPGYAKGWIVSGNQAGHNGAMSGTIAFLWKANNGLTMAVTVNTRPSSDKYVFKLRDTILNAMNTVSSWPTYDLF